MMRKALIYITLTLLSLLSLEGKAQGVIFFEGTVYEALDEAKRTGKMLLVEFYADWDHSSRWMHQIVSNTTELNYWFIVSSLNTNERENAGLAQVYQVEKYPAIVIFNTKGDPVDKLSKAMDRPDFEEYLREIRLQNEVSFVDYKEIMYYAEGDNGLTREQVEWRIKDFLERSSDDILTSVSTWELFLLDNYSNYDSALYKYLIKNYEKFYDSNKAMERAQQIYYEAIMPFVSGSSSDTLLLEKLQSDTLSLSKIACATHLINLAKFRENKDAIGYLSELETTLSSSVQSIDYQLILSMDFIPELLNEQNKATKRKARQILEEYLKYCTSSSKITIIESLLEKFS